MELQNRQTANNSSVNLPAENASLDARSLTETEGLEKRSRFSLYSGGYFLNLLYIVFYHVKHLHFINQMISDSCFLIFTDSFLFQTPFTS